MKLSPSATAVLAALEAQPGLGIASNGIIAKRLHCSGRTVSRALEQLESAGLLRLIYRKATGPGDAGRYIELLPQGSPSRWLS